MSLDQAERFLTVYNIGDRHYGQFGDPDWDTLFVVDTYDSEIRLEGNSVGISLWMREAAPHELPVFPSASPKKTYTSAYGLRKPGRN